MELGDPHLHLKVMIGGGVVIQTDASWELSRLEFRKKGPEGKREKIQSDLLHIFDVQLAVASPHSTGQIPRSESCSYFPGLS